MVANNLSKQCLNIDIIKYSRAFRFYSDFIKRNLCQSTKLLNQGYIKKRLVGVLFPKGVTSLMC